LSRGRGFVKGPYGTREPSASSYRPSALLPGSRRRRKRPPEHSSGGLLTAL